MKRIVQYLLLVVVAITIAASCSDSENTYHYLNVTSVSTSSSYALLYADQRSDILRITASDDWTASAQVQWMSFAESGASTLEHKVTNVYAADTLYSARVSVQPNLTDSTRAGYIRVSTYKYNVGLPVYQVGYLNITSITPTFSDPTSHNGVAFALTTQAADTQETLSFYIYQAATLSADADWVTIDNSRYQAGQNTATLTLQPNTTGQSRTATLTLRSDCGALTTVSLTQNG